jgi:hypothetical protein
LRESFIYIGDLACKSQPARLFEARKQIYFSDSYQTSKDYAQAAKKPHLCGRFFRIFFSLSASPF